MIKGRRGNKQRAATRIEGIGVKAEKKKNHNTTTNCHSLERKIC